MKQPEEDKVRVSLDPKTLSNDEILGVLKAGTSFGNDRLQLLDVLKRRDYSQRSDSQIVSPDGEVIEIAREKKQDKTAYGYLVAWITMVAIGYVIGLLLERLSDYGFSFLTAEITAITRDSVWRFYFFWGLWGFVIVCVLALLPFIITYFLIFKSLDSSKVLVWYYIFGTVSFFSSYDTLAVNFEKMKLVDFDMRFISWPALAAWIISCVVVRELSKMREARKVHLAPNSKVH